MRHTCLIRDSFTRALTALLGATLLVALSGCARFQTWQMKREVQEVAKRWCLTIRASQVIPVYPLNEDVLPGDVFIVRTTTKEQASEYTRRGFLPLDYHFKRLDAPDYASFYEAGYIDGEFAKVPHPRPARPDTDKPPKPDAPNVPQFRLQPIPGASFPSYTFETEHGAGLQLAVPVHGVPVGLGLMGASKASGSISIKEAFTYGTDELDMLKKLDKWLTDNREIRHLLAQMKKESADPVYLRVVHRVFLVGSVDVSLQAAGASSGALDVGAAKPVNPFTMTKEEAETLKSSAAAYKEAIKVFSEAINAAAPGGSLRLVQANKGSITLNESFERLLVIGYRGFDVEVLEGGEVSAPIATQQLLEGKTTAPVAPEAIKIKSLSEQSIEAAERVVTGIAKGTIPAADADRAKALAKGSWKKLTDDDKHFLGGLSNTLEFYRDPIVGPQLHEALAKKILQ